MTLPKDAAARKAIPVYTGVLKYFPDALAEVAKVSAAGSAQHHPGQPVHWDRAKSGDQLDALARHLLDHAATGSIESLAQIAWRALAQLQLACEAGVVTPKYSETRRRVAALIGVDPSISAGEAEIAAGRWTDEYDGGSRYRQLDEALGLPQGCSWLTTLDALRAAWETP